MQTLIQRPRLDWPSWRRKNLERGQLDSVLFPDQPLGLTVDHDQPDSSSLKFLALDMWQSAIFIEAIFYRAKLIETEDLPNPCVERH